MAIRVTPGRADLRDPVVFGAFYDEALPAIYGYFLRRCGGERTIAEDLTQEVFMAAVRQIGRGVAVEEPLRWLYGIARHRLIDHYRQHLRESERVVAWNDRAEVHADDRDEMATLIDRDAAIAALDALVPAQRMMIALRYLDGMSVPEIALATGKSVHAIESLLVRGRAAFKRIYLEHGHE
jgi:RNA polymerase sigma-70 factor (ECF subfamily)